MNLHTGLITFSQKVHDSVYKGLFELHTQEALEPKSMEEMSH